MGETVKAIRGLFMVSSLWIVVSLAISIIQHGSGRGTRNISADHLFSCFDWISFFSEHGFHGFLALVHEVHSTFVGSRYHGHQRSSGVSALSFHLRSPVKSPFALSGSVCWASLLRADANAGSVRCFVDLRRPCFICMDPLRRVISNDLSKLVRVCWTLSVSRPVALN